MFQTPILFLIFNRLDSTKLVFAEIKKQQPQQLFIAADGARKHIIGEDEECKRIRKWVIDNIDWKCKVTTRFQTENQGCGKHVSGAISWFFEHVEQGIILEDDCIAHNDFFKYCNELLNKYKDNPNIYMIGGNNFNPRYSNQNSYYFSVIGHIWGWATWRRAWKQYDFTLQSISEHQFIQQANKYFSNRQMADFWVHIFKMMKYNPIDTWDYQWTIAQINNKAFAITPVVNLVSNIGFDNNATHTTGYIQGISNLPVCNILPLTHPSSIKRDKNADLYTFYKNFEAKKKSQFIQKCKDKIRYEIKKMKQRIS